MSKDKFYQSAGSGEIVSDKFGEENPLTTVAHKRKPRRTFSPTELSFKKAVKGLVFVSETDAPFEVMTNAALPLGKTEVIDFGEFFDKLTKEEDWHSAAEKETAGRFQYLRARLETELAWQQVLKIQKSPSGYEIFIFGADAFGSPIEGIRTKAVET